MRRVSLKLAFSQTKRTSVLPNHGRLRHCSTTARMMLLDPDKPSGSLSQDPSNLNLGGSQSNIPRREFK
ncbi:hypothetical protein N7505_007407 [Penicillium chrysogenum]|uniref:Uncharacterized protein n=1 Tax=Penicillium chrysogenum TaxID=5076 RepID=A0ABQ8WE91_PENCH|nr:hypothetical protein N7505_007407 [Penicillium chrysogenum]